MNSNPFKFLENNSTLIVLQSLSIALAVFINYNGEIIYSILICIVAVLAFMIWAIRYSRKNDGGFVDAKKVNLNILLIFDSENEKLANEIKNKYGNENLTIKEFNITTINDIGEFKVMLRSSDAVYCFWSKELEEDQEYLSEIKEWGLSNRAKPIILITEEENIKDLRKDKTIKENLKKFKIIKTETAIDSLWFLLMRSIDRGGRYLKLSSIWRNLFFSTFVFSIFILALIKIEYLDKGKRMDETVYMGLIASYNDFRELEQTLSLVYSDTGYIAKDSRVDLTEEKTKVLKSLNSYLKHAEADIKSKANSEVFLSMWRNFKDTLNLKNVVYKVGIPDLPIENSIAGCACETGYYVSWKKDIKDGDAAAWNRMTREVAGNWVVTDDSKSIRIGDRNYNYFEENNTQQDFKRSGLICVGNKINNSDECHVICIDAIHDPAILNEPWLREYILNLALFSSLIPNEVFITR